MIKIIFYSTLEKVQSKGILNDQAGSLNLNHFFEFGGSLVMWISNHQQMDFFPNCQKRKVG